MNGSRNLPGEIGLGIGLVAADMASPDDARAGAPEALHQPRGLRVVQEDDVAGADAGPHLVEVGRERVGDNGIFTF